MKVLKFPIKMVSKIFRWATRTRLRKILSSILAILMILTSIKYIFVYPDTIKAADIYLGMDEGYGTSLGDHNNTLPASTITGATWQKEGLCVVGKCLYFSAADANVTLTDTAALDYGAGSFTVEFWFRQNTKALDYLVSKYQNGAGTDSAGFAVRIQADGDLEFVTDDDSSFTPDDLAGTAYNDNRYNDSQWHFVSAVKNSNTSLYLYVDGVKVAEDLSISGTGSLDNSNNLTIGHDGAGAADFTGFIDEFKMYAYARSESQIKADFVAVANVEGSAAAFSPNQSYVSNGLVGYWNLDQTSSPATDFSGFGNNGTWTNSPVSVGGKFGTALEFDGTNNKYVDINSAPEFNTPHVSVSAWAYTDTWIDTTGIVGRDDSSTNRDWGLGLGSISNSFRFHAFIGNTQYNAQSTTNFSTAAWHFLVGTYDGANLKLYVDGTLVATTPIVGSMDTDTKNIHIGKKGTAEYFDGKVDEVRVYNRALSQSEVTNLYNWAPGPVAYWNVDENTGGTAYDRSTNANSGTLSTSTSGSEATADFKVDMEENNLTDFDTTSDPDSDLTVTSGAALAGTNYGMNVVYDDANSSYGQKTVTLSSATDFRVRFYFDLNGLTFGSADSFSILTANITSTARYRVNIEWGTTYELTHVAFNDAGTTTAGTDTLIHDIPHYVESHITRATNSTSIDGVYRLYLDGVLIDTISGIDNYDAFASINNIRVGIAGIADATTAGNIFVDELVYRDDATEIGAYPVTQYDPKWEQGKFGNALKFDGDNDVVTVSDATSIDLGATRDSYTVEAWFKTTKNYSASGSILNKWSGGSTFPFVLYINTSEQGCFEMWDGSVTVTTCGSATLNDGKWHHIAGKRDVLTDTAYIYIDGVQVNSTTDTTTATMVNNDTVCIGNGGSSCNAVDFDGQLDDLKIYNYARTSEQIITDMNAGHPAPGSPVGSATGHWKFDEGRNDSCSGGSNDTCNSGNSGSTLDGTVNGFSSPPTSTSGWAGAGKFGKALTFDGTGDYVQVADATPLDITGDFTLSAWVYRTGGINGYVISKTNTNDGGYALLHGQNGEIYCRTSNGSTYVDSYTATGLLNADSTWHHLTAVKSGSSCRVYFDGVDRTNTVGTHSSLTANANNLRIGLGLNGSDGVIGKIDEVKIYNSALNADQVKAEFNHGSSAVMGAFSTDTTGNASFSTERKYCPPGNTDANCGSGNPSPVGEWLMDENSGSTIRDSTGHEENPTVNGALWTNGIRGSALDFDGVDDYAQSTTIPSDLITLGDMTASVWIKPDTAQSGELIFSVRGGGEVEADNETVLMEWDVSSGNDVRYQHENGAGVNSSNTFDTNLTLGQWYHLLVTRDTDTNTVKLFVNGIQTGTTYTYTNDPTGATAADVRIGGNTGADFFDGKIDQIRVFNYTFTDALAAWDYNYGKPMGWWRMDESSWTNNCSTDTAMDASGNGLHADSCPNTTGPTGAATGKFNNGGSFDGSNDYLNVAANSKLNITGDITLSAWIKRSNTTQKGLIMAKTDGSSNWDYEFGVDDGAGNNDKLYVWADPPGPNTAVYSTGTISDTNWHHVAFTRSGSTATFYIDGVASGSSTMSGNFNTNSLALRIGGDGGTIYFIGTMDDARIYNYSVTTQQIKTIMNEGAALRYGPNN
jgi:hypothetical protein